MSVSAALSAIATSLNGSKVSPSDFQSLIDSLPPTLVPDWLAMIMQDHPLSGVSFSLSEDDDESGLGAELMWYSPAQMMEEALQYYPGMAVAKLGYLPVATCLIGSGDPYFLRLKGDGADDPALVRVPHDFVGEDDSYPEDKIEIVSDSLSRFFRLAVID